MSPDAPGRVREPAGQRAVSASPRSVAVTGGSGQLGTLVIRRLVNDPDVERVIAIDLQPPFVASPKLTAVRADIRDGDLARHLDNCEALVHCAALVASGAPDEMVRSVNVEGGKNVFRAAVTAGLHTIVHMSSITAYGCMADHPVPLREDSPRRQSDFSYAASKFELEEFLDGFEQEHPDVAISRIRANVLVGRHMRHLFGWSLHAGWIPNLGKAPLPLIWDEDVADLVVLALRARARGPFNAAAGELLVADELAERAEMVSVRPLQPLGYAYRSVRAALMSMGLNLLSDPAWFDKMQDAMLVASTDRARTELGWSPTVPTATAVIRRFREEVPLAVDLRVQLLLSLWMRTLTSLSLDCPGPHRINLLLDGRSGRDLTLLIADSRFRIASGPRPGPTSTIRLRDALLRDLLTGAAETGSARRAGLISVEGNPADWDVFELVVSGLVDRQRLRDPGAALFRRLASFAASSPIGGSARGGHH